jgi:hypothetical protein
LFPRPWGILNPSDAPYRLVSLINTYIALVFLSLLFGGLATSLKRLARGYEALISEPSVTSFLIEANYSDIFALTKDFLNSLSIDYTVMITKDTKYVDFSYYTNRHHLFLREINESSVEINLATVNMLKETLLTPNQERLDTFLVYFKAYLNNKKYKNEPLKWTTEFKPLYADSTRIIVWKILWTPLKITQKLATRPEWTQKPVQFIESNKKQILTFAGGVAIAIIAQIILHYFGIT